MTVLIPAVVALIIGLTVGSVIGLTVGTTRTREATNLRLQREGVALARALLINPDAWDLRPQAQKIVAAADAATNRKDT